MDAHEPKCPHLPLELWTRIIGYITDCRYLPRVWLNCRRISHTFKAATETAFITKHLPHTRIEFDIDNSHTLWGVEDNRIVADSIFVKFSHLTEDRQRAVFVRESSYERSKSTQLSSGGNLFDHTIKQWRNSMQRYFEEPGYATQGPRHMLYVRREVNDTTLPGLQVDFENIEVSLLWRPMLSTFYGDAEYLKWAQKVYSQHNPVDGCVKEMVAQVHAGTMSVDEYLEYALDTVSKKVERVQAEARRQRFIRWHAKHGSAKDADLVKEIGSGPDDFPLMRKSLVGASNAMQMADFDDEHDEDSREKSSGNFYDGLGYTLLGNTEMGPSMDSHEGEVYGDEDYDDDEEEDDDDASKSVGDERDDGASNGLGDENTV
ncbi:hypothetical protein PG995_004023 [Apiospora arundinis]